MTPTASRGRWDIPDPDPVRRAPWTRIDRFTMEATEPKSAGHVCILGARSRVMDRAPFVSPVPWQQGAELRHFGIDELDPLVAVHGDAVVTVLHEVGASDLVQAHRRQLLAAGERPVYALPLGSRALPEG